MMVAASHTSSVYIISWYVAWGLLNFNDCCYHFKTTAWKLGSVSYSKLKTRLLGNCIEKETIHSILKTSEVRLRSEVWDSLPQSWGLRICCLSYARDKKKRHLSLFLYWAQNLPSLLLYFKTVYILHNKDLRRMYAQDPLRSFRVDVFDSKEDYQIMKSEQIKPRNMA